MVWPRENFAELLTAQPPVAQVYKRAQQRGATNGGVDFRAASQRPRMRGSASA
jgi:hypothetical protein